MFSWIFVVEMPTPSSVTYMAEAKASAIPPAVAETQYGLPTVTVAPMVMSPPVWIVSGWFADAPLSAMPTAVEALTERSASAL
jgi:hypothetical protein